MHKKIGVVGLGSMGFGTARAAIAGGFSVMGYDLRAEALQALDAAGGEGVSDLARLGRESDIVVLLVLNAAQAEAVLFDAGGLADAMSPGNLLVMSVTVAPAKAMEFAERLAANGILMLDAPVSGGQVKAASGDLTIMASGSDEAFDAAEELFQAIAEKVYRLSNQAGDGSRIKLVNQLLAGVHIASMAEAMALAIKMGLEPATVFEIITNSAGNSWMFENRGAHVVDGDYSPASAVNVFVKDLGIVLDTGRAETFPTPLSATAHQQFMSAAAAGFGAEDDAAVIKVFKMLTGIELPEKK